MTRCLRKAGKKTLRQTGGADASSSRVLSRRQLEKKPNDALNAVVPATPLTPTERTLSVQTRRLSKQMIAAKRQKMMGSSWRPLEASSGGRSFLEQSAVRAPTADDYTRRVEAFVAWLRLNGFNSIDDEDVDLAVTDYFDSQFALGAHPGEGSKLLAAIGHFYPRFSKLGGLSLVRAGRALQGWTRLAPARARAPLPWSACIAMVGAAAYRRRFPTALFLLLCFAMYPRPGELLTVTPERIVRPQPQAGNYARHWSMVLAPSEMLVAGKTGEFDETLRLDWDELAWISPIMEMLCQQAPGISVWPFDARILRQHFTEAAADCLVSQLASSPYSLRHGGASHDALTSRRPLSEIKKKGRWQSDASVRRYEKASLALAQLAKVPTNTQLYSKQVEAQLENIMLRRVAAPCPPGLARPPR